MARVLGLTVFEFDTKEGPKEVYRTRDVEEVTSDEMIAIFATHGVFSGGFRGVYIGKRTWASFIKQQWLIALLLSPDEPIGPLETIIRSLLKHVELDEMPTKRQWNTIYRKLLREINKSPASDLLTSESTAAFLKKLLNKGIIAFEPQFSFEIGVIYAEANRITGLNSYDTRLFLEKLALASIFVTEPVGGALICPNCRSFKVATRFACPHCQAATLEITRIENPSAPKPDNPNPDSGANDPHYSCSSCLNLTQQPIITLECTKCKIQFRPTDAEYHQFFRLILERSSAKALVQNIEKQFLS